MIYKRKQIIGKTTSRPKWNSNLKQIEISNHQTKQEKGIQKTQQKIKPNRLKSKSPMTKINNLNPQKTSQSITKIVHFKSQAYFGSDNDYQKVLLKKQQPKLIVSMKDTKNPYFSQATQEIGNHFIFQDSNPFSIKDQQQSQQSIVNLIKTPREDISLLRMSELLQKKDRQIENLTNLIAHLKRKNQIIKQTYQSFYCWKQIVQRKIRKQLVEIAENFSKQRQQFSQTLKKTFESRNLKQQEGIYINKGLRQSFLKGIYKMNVQALQIIDLIDKQKGRLSNDYKNGLLRSNSLEQIRSIQVRYKSKVLPTIGNKQVRFNTKNIDSIVFLPMNNGKNIVIGGQSSNHPPPKHQNDYLLYSPTLNRKNSKDH